MKSKRAVILGVLAVMLVAYGMSITIIPSVRRQAEWRQAFSALHGLSRDRVLTAVEAFTRARKASGGVVPAIVQFSDHLLVRIRTP